MEPPVAAAMSFITQGLSDGEETDAVGIFSIDRLFISVMNSYISYRFCYQLCSWLNGSGKEVHSQKELQSPIPQKLQSQRKDPIFMWFKKVAGREVETL